MKLFHGSNVIDSSDIISGTVLKLNYGRFGNAIYFFDSYSEAKDWAMNVIEVFIDEDPLLIQYDDLIEFDPNLNIIEEEGLTNLRDYVDNDFVCIEYSNGDKEYVVYDERLIKYI